MIKTVFLVFVAVVLAFAIGMFVHLGAYKTPKVGMQTIPGMTLLYVDHTGPYNLVALLMDEVQQWATRHNITCEKTFGEYLDNPKTTDERRLRSHVGCVVDSTFAPADLAKIVKRGPYKLETYPAGRYLWASFDGSPAIGPIKVYPRLRQFARDHHLQTGTATLEVYMIRGIHDMTTNYYEPILSAPAPNEKISAPRLSTPLNRATH